MTTIILSLLLAAALAAFAITLGKLNSERDNRAIDLLCHRHEQLRHSFEVVAYIGKLHKVLRNALDVIEKQTYGDNAKKVKQEIREILPITKKTTHERNS